MRYRYYVSQAILKGRAAGSITRIPAPEIEHLVLGALRSAVPSLDPASPDAGLIEQHLKASWSARTASSSR